MLQYKNLNTQFNMFYSLDNLNCYGRYPYIKAYIKSFLQSTQEHYDSDVSFEAMEFYKNKYDFLKNGLIENKLDNYNKNEHKKQIKLSDEEYVIFGDTLNSFKHLFNYFLTEYSKNLPKDNVFKNKKWTNNDYVILDKNFDEIFTYVNLSKTKYANIILNYFEIFAQLSDTIGNIFPCPPLFNSERSNFGKYDFSDIFLESIYNYLSKQDDKYIDKLFEGINDIKNKNGTIYKKDKHISDSKERLKFYLQRYFSNSWDAFIRINHFEHNVNIINGICKEPKPLWTGHSINNSNYPTLNEEFIYMLSNIITSIIVRNESFT